MLHVTGVAVKLIAASTEDATGTVPQLSRNVRDFSHVVHML